MADLTVEFFVALETKVWEALVAGDPEADAAQLSEDFLGVYTDGFANRDQHAAQLSDGPTAATYAIEDARIRVLAEDEVLLSYQADWTRMVEGVAGEVETMYITSLWSRRAGEWINTFSQDTPAG